MAMVQWVGQRTVALTETTTPVRFARDAMGSGMPTQDVWLSPDHAVFVDGVLIPAAALVNGATISRDASDASVTYVHVELDRHDLVISDGMVTESYLDTGNRGQFDAECGVRPMFPQVAEDPLQAARAAYAARACAPLHLGGETVERVHQRLLNRALDQGWQLVGDPALLVTADDQTIRGQSVDRPDHLLFALPAGARRIRIRSRAFIPAAINPDMPDGRRLGVAAALWLDGNPPGPNIFTSGWHAPEAECEWRWTTGDALLSVDSTPSVRRLEIRLMECGAQYWNAPDRLLISDARRDDSCIERHHRA